VAFVIHPKFATSFCPSQFRWGGGSVGQNSLKVSTPLPLMTTYRMILLSARFISPDRVLNDSYFIFPRTYQNNDKQECPICKLYLLDPSTAVPLRVRLLCHFKTWPI